MSKAVKYKNAVLARKDLYAGQDLIMQSIANGLLLSKESGEDETVIEVARVLAERIGRRFGYESWPGIFSAEIDAISARK